MRHQTKVVSVGLLLILTLIGISVIYNFQVSSKQIMCESVAEQVKNTILQTKSMFSNSGGIAIVEIDFPKDLRYKIYNQSGDVYLYLYDCNKTTLIGKRVSLLEEEIINREKVWLYVSPARTILSGNLSKINDYIKEDSSLSACVFCTGRCCKVNDEYVCYSGTECCNSTECNLPECIASGGTPQCVDGYCTCQCPDNKYWNGTACVDRPGYEYCDPSVPLPPRWDWRNVNGKNYVTRVRDQANCGSCWAFSAVGAVEADYKVENNLPGVDINLSVQNLLSPGCGAGGRGCNGGNPLIALEYIRTAGIVNESCFPYNSKDCVDRRGVCKSACVCSLGCCANPCSCNLCLNPKRWRISGYHLVGSSIEEVKRALICYGPLSVGSDNWKHAVVIVGYDDHNATCYNKYGKWGCWIVKNSWGVVTGWWPPECSKNSPKPPYCIWMKDGYVYIPYSGHPFSDIKDFAIAIENVILPN